MNFWYAPAKSFFTKRVLPSAFSRSASVGLVMLRGGQVGFEHALSAKEACSFDYFIPDAARLTRTEQFAKGPQP